jgi:hypothetical protein
VRLTDDSGAYVAPGGGTTDKSAWTQSASTFNPVGGVFNDSATALTAGQQGTVRSTNNRALHVNVRDSAGNEATLTGNSLNVNVTNGAAGGTSMADKAAFTVGTTNGTPAFGLVRTDVPDLVVDATGASLASTLRRGLHVNLRSQVGAELLGQKTMAGSLPVAIASDQGNLPINNVQIGGVNISTGSGVMGTGVQRVAIASDNDPVPIKSTAANAKVDIGLINAVTPLMGSGIMGTGSLRVTIASDNDPVTVKQATAANLLATVTQGPQGTIAASWRVQVTDLTNTMPTMDAVGRKGFVAVTDGTNTAAVKAASTNAAATDPSLVVAISPNNNGSKTSANSIPVVIASDQAAITVAQATAANLKATVIAAGDVAHDSPDSGNPVKVGAKAYTSSITSVANADRVDLIADKQGALIVVPNKPREFIRTQTTTITASTTETTIITAGGAGVFNDIISLTITNSSATATLVTLKDATAGTTRAVYSIAANGGITIPFPTPLAQQAVANSNWTLTCGTSVSSIIASAVYIINT